MLNVTNYVDDIHDFTSFFGQEVSRSHASIQSRMAEAEAIAERKLAEMQLRKAGRDTMEPTTDQPVHDQTAAFDIKEKVQTIRKERDAIRSLITVTPQSCGRASVQVMHLRSNISHLRQQVNAAKALLQAMQLSISKSGSGYLSIPVSPKDSTQSSPRISSTTTPSVSMLTTVELCLKTGNSDGPILLVKGNNSASFSLAVDDGKISVTVYDVTGKELQTVVSDIAVKENTWYNVRIARTGKKVLLRVTLHGETTETPAISDVTVSAMTYLQSTPVHIYVGGVADNEPFSVGSDTWQGCLGNLHVNGREVSLLYAANSDSMTELCTSHCTSTSESSSLVFDGAGFLHFPSSVLPGRRRIQSVRFLFRSRQASTALLHLVSQEQKFLLRVMLADGALMIDTKTPTESITLRTQRSGYNDDIFHTLKIQYRQGTTYPEIDGIDGAFTIEKSNTHDLQNAMDGVVIGAFVTRGHAFEKSRYRPLIGCLQKLEIDDIPLTISQAVTSTGVFSGTCTSANSNSVWSQCVQFGTDSSGIDLGELDRSATVVLLFSSESRGPLLMYSREGKIEAEIATTDEGLQVMTEEDDLSLVRPDGVTEHFVLLTVSDDGKNVKYSAWNEEVQTSYGGFWDSRADVDGVHHVQLGLPADPTSSAQFVGQMAQVMVGDRFINLSDYTSPNNLMSCERPLPDLVTSETIPDMTSSAETCSRDIRC